MSVPYDNPRLLKAQYVALSNQIPLLYFILLVNSLALAWTHVGSAPRWLVLEVPAVLSLISISRAVTWWRSRHVVPTPEGILRRLHSTSRMAGIIPIGFTAWALALFPYGGVYAQAHVAFYMAITVIGCIFCLMHLRPAAFSVAVLVNVAFVVFFAMTRNPTFIAMAFNVLLVSVAMLIILQNHYRDFTRLVNMQAKTEKLSNENLRLANMDSLTGLPNRRQFFTTLERSLARARETHSRLAVGLIDLDGFKPVNDLYGHSVGDKLLCLVGERLQSLLDDHIHVARLGGDEFGVIFENVASDLQLAGLGRELCAELRQPFVLVDVPLQVGASLGIATFPDLARNASEVFEYADYALYQSKRHSPGTLSLFTAHHHQQLHREGMTEQALRRADLESELSVVFQPIVDVRDASTVAFEALARWSSAELGPVSPAQFIPVAERIGIITRLTLPLLTKALAAAQTWPAPIRLSFNLSAHDCASAEAGQLIVDTILASGFDPSRLDLEITETAFMQDIFQAQRVIAMFHALGCGISLDDFGTGYSSLSQLHALSLNKLKIDRSFVTAIERKPASYKIVKSLVALSQDMALDCIVEGVETVEELEALQSLGCVFVQGYLFSRPISLEQTHQWLQTTA